MPASQLSHDSFEMMEQNRPLTDGPSVRLNPPQIHFVSNVTRQGSQWRGDRLGVGCAVAQACFQEEATRM